MAIWGHSYTMGTKQTHIHAGKLARAFYFMWTYRLYDRLDIINIVNIDLKLQFNHKNAICYVKNMDLQHAGSCQQCGLYKSYR